MFKSSHIDSLIPDSSVSNLEPLDFKEWLHKTNLSYNQNYNFISSYIKSVRAAHNFSFDDDDSNKEDPIKTSPYCNIIREYKEIYEQAYEKLNKNTIFQEKIAELQKFNEEETRQDNLKVTVNDKEFKAIDMCDVLWSGWECDYYAWVVEDEGEKKLVTSDHGHRSFSDKEFLINKIKEYEKAIEDSKRLISLLKV